MPSNKFKNKYRIQSTRLKNRDYRYGHYFVTICTYERKCILGEIVNGQMVENEYGTIVREEWFKTPQIRSNVILDAFVIMPNHIHGIIILETTQRVVSTGKIQSGTLGAIIGQFKSQVTKRINAMGYNHIIWQPRFYDHIIRNEEDLIRIMQYMENNPQQWHLDHENPLSK